MNIIQIGEKDIIGFEKTGIWSWRIRISIYHNDNKIASLKAVDNEFFQRIIGGKEVRIETKYKLTGRVNLKVYIDGELQFDSRVKLKEK